MHVLARQNVYGMYTGRHRMHHSTSSVAAPPRRLAEDEGVKGGGAAAPEAGTQLQLYFPFLSVLR